MLLYTLNHSSETIFREIEMIPIHKKTCCSTHKSDTDKCCGHWMFQISIQHINQRDELCASTSLHEIVTEFFLYPWC